MAFVPGDAGALRRTSAPTPCTSSTGVFEGPGPAVGLSTPRPLCPESWPPLAPTKPSRTQSGRARAGGSVVAALPSCDPAALALAPRVSPVAAGHGSARGALGRQPGRLCLATVARATVRSKGVMLTTFGLSAPCSASQALPFVLERPALPLCSGRGGSVTLPPGTSADTGDDKKMVRARPCRASAPQ